MSVFLIGVISDLKKPPAEQEPVGLQGEITEKDEKANKENPEFAIIDLEKKLIKGEDGETWYPLQLQRRTTKEQMEAIAENECFFVVNVQSMSYYNPSLNSWMPLPTRDMKEAA